MELQTRKLNSIEREKSIEETERNLSFSTNMSLLKMAKNDPLAPYPNKAILTTKKAK